ncbi:regulatory protein rpfe, partial [mine drainage metagenome]
MSTQTLLLPPLSRLSGVSALPRLLGRGDREPAQVPGLLAALAEVFAVPGSGLPVAALLREAQTHDAGENVWLCADPAWV